MTDIDPEEDKFVSTMKEIGISIFKFVFALTDSSMEQFQGLSKVEMEIQLMFDEILQIDAETRTRVDVERIVMKFMDRYKDKHPIQYDSVQQLADNLFELFSIPKSSTS